MLEYSTPDYEEDYEDYDLKDLDAEDYYEDRVRFTEKNGWEHYEDPVGEEIYDYEDYAENFPEDYNEYVDYYEVDDK